MCDYPWDLRLRLGLKPYDDDVLLMFQLWGTIVIFELRQTTVNELNQFPHISLTSYEHWEPSNIEIIPDYTEEVEYVHNTDSTNLRIRCIPSIIASVNLEPANPVLIYGSTESDI